MTETTAYNRPVRVLGTVGHTAHVEWLDNHTVDYIPTEVLA